MSDRPDPFEDELREALRSGSESTDPDDADSDALKRIHRGATLRRRRRRAGTVVAVAALAGAIVVGAPMVSPTPEPSQTAEPGGSARTSEPTAAHSGRRALEPGRKYTIESVPPGKVPPGQADRVDPPRIAAGTPVSVRDLHVASVSGSAPDRFWVSGSGSCGGHLCNVLGVADASGDSPDLEYRALPGSPRQLVTTVRFSGDGVTGWATNGVATFGTINGGQKWFKLRQPEGVRVKALEAWGDEAWAVGYRATDPVVMATREGSTELTELTEAPDAVADQAVALGQHSFGVGTDGANGEFLRTDDGGRQWHRSTIGCKPSDVSATFGAVWALCGGSRPELVTSLDEGQTWQPPEPLQTASSDPPYLVAAIDTDTAFVASDTASWVVDRNVPLPVEGLEGPYTYVGFTSAEVGYVIDSDGKLCRTEDGGRTWERVDTP